jgi:hypothetical protein
MFECNIPYILKPKYNKECNEYYLFSFFLNYGLIPEITFKNYYVSNHGKPTTNYKSIHFIINNKELKKKNYKIIF